VKSAVIATQERLCACPVCGKIGVRVSGERFGHPVVCATCYQRLYRAEQRRANVRPTAAETIAALRAVLAPLLERPFEYRDGRLSSCFFCGYHDNPHGAHFNDCAVLRRDELLGR